MTNFAKALLVVSLFLLSFHIAAAQSSGSFKLAGDLDKFYPVTFYDGGWYSNAATELQIGRSGVHLDGTSWGSVIATFRYHVTNCGHASNFIDADIRQSVSPNQPNAFIAGWRDGTTCNSSYVIIIWLRGNTTYFYSANYAVNPGIYDGVTNPLPYRQPDGLTYTYKTAVDGYVNEQGASYAHTAYFNGSGTNYFAGNVGIGTKGSGAYKLTVEGAIGARKVKVTQGSWADFVFQPDYKLPSLQEVERYIKANRHLPDMPSAGEVEKEGLDLGETDKRLLQKIEELTLYLIDQQKQLKSQQEQINLLQQQNRCLLELIKEKN